MAFGLLEDKLCDQNKFMKLKLFYTYILIHSTFGEYCTVSAFCVNTDQMYLLLAIETGHLRINEKEGRDFIKWTIIRVNE